MLLLPTLRKIVAPFQYQALPLSFAAERLRLHSSSGKLAINSSRTLSTNHLYHQCFPQLRTIVDTQDEYARFRDFVSVAHGLKRAISTPADIALHLLSGLNQDPASLLQMYVDLGLEWLQGLSVPAIGAWLMCFAINHRINLGGSLKL